jgi:hypothetical protein
LDNFSGAMKIFKKLFKFDKTSFSEKADYADVRLKYLTLWCEKAGSLLEPSNFNKLSNFNEAILYYNDVINPTFRRCLTNLFLFLANI